jgi:GrpB-like predicted nucleotidyltransferase (UPF0157 family)
MSSVAVEAPGEILVVEYDPRWPELFEALRSSVWPAVSDVALSIEHVGSTSVPGLAAKPVIDLDVVVPRAHVATGIARLTGLGYVHRGDLGVPQREAFVRPEGTPAHHLYLCPAESLALANHRAIRDYLRENPAAARNYGSLKQRLAVTFAGDMAGYVRAKTGFLSAILREVGFSEELLAEIEGINR